MSKENKEWKYRLKARSAENPDVGNFKMWLSLRYMWKSKAQCIGICMMH